MLTAQKEIIPSVRLLSLDVFRGFNIVLMLLVNNIALDVYTPDQLMHGPWNQGIRIADLVFPWFLLCVGLSIPFAEAAAVKRGFTERDLVRRIWKRGAVIFFWGLVLSSALEKKPVFTLGVLQLIALAFVAGSFICRLRPRTQAILCGGLLVGYGLFASLTPFPGGPAFEEGANVFNWLNSLSFFEVTRLKGLTSVIPTAPLVVIGAWAAGVVRREDLDFPEKLRWLVTRGAALMLAGALWNFWLPYNKPVWTPSYILMSGGLGLVVLAGFFAWFDGSWERHRSAQAEGARVWVYFGSNALLAYVLPILVKLLWFKAWTLPSPSGRAEMHAAALEWLKLWFGPIWGGSMYTAGYIGAFWLLFAWFYQRKLFLKA